MAIDRIGKGGAPPQVPETGSTGAVQPKERAERPFQVERAHEAQKADAAQPLDATTPLARLRAGEIDVHGHIDLKVDEATASLKGLSPSQLDEIKKVLREQMASDPGLADLVRTATGQTPKPPED